MKLIYCFILLLAAVACREQNNFDVYGSAFTYDQVSTLTQAIPTLTSGDTVNVKLTGEVDEVCQVKGCWMTLKTANGHPVRVTFKDYGFFVPKDAGGKKVIINGVATLKQLDEATARHYAEDAGTTYDETSDRNEVSIVASGVLIKNTPGSGE